MEDNILKILENHEDLKTIFVNTSVGEIGIYKSNGILKAFYMNMPMNFGKISNDIKKEILKKLQK